MAFHLTQIRKPPNKQFWCSKLIPIHITWNWQHITANQPIHFELGKKLNFTFWFNSLIQSSLMILVQFKYVVLTWMRNYLKSLPRCLSSMPAQSANVRVELNAQTISPFNVILMLIYRHMIMDIINRYENYFKNQVPHKLPLENYSVYVCVCVCIVWVERWGGEHIMNCE